MARNDGSEPAKPERIARRPASDAMPVSFAQGRLWFLDRFGHSDPVFNLRAALRLRGKLDHGALQAALDAVVARHDALRTTFTAGDGVPRQHIHPPQPVDLEVTDLPALPAPQVEDELRRRYIRSARRSFDLSCEALFRAHLFRLSAADHVLLLMMHHIVADGWSLQIVVRELAQHYNRCGSDGRPASGGPGGDRPRRVSATPGLAELPVRYVDFAAWQNEQWQADRWAPQLAYWKAKLAGAPATLQLPTDLPRPPARTSAGARSLSRLPSTLAADIQQFSREQRCTPFMVLLAAFAALLTRYTGDTDIVIGAPIAGRNRAELENVVGCFINTLALRIDSRDDPRFRDLLRQVRTTTLEAFTHQDVPFEKLVEELQPPRRLSHTPIFQVMLAFQNVPAAPVELAGLEAQRFTADCGTSNFDLTLFVEPDPDGLTVTSEYSTELFEEHTIARLAGHYEALLRAAVADADQRVSALSLWRANGRIAGEGPPTTTEPIAADDPRPSPGATDDRETAGPGHEQPFRSVVDLFEAQAHRTPQAPAVAFEDTLRTYREVRAQADRLARRLRDRGAGAEAVVGVLLERSADLPAALLGVLKAGGAFLPLDVAFPARRQAFMLRDCGATLLLTHDALAGGLADLDIEVMVLDEDRPGETSHDGGTTSHNGGRPASTPREPAAAAGARPEDCPGAKPHQLAYVIYTSGSTGIPKGVQIEHRSLANLLTAMQRAPGVDHTDRWLAVTTLSFDIALAELLLPLIAGGQVIIASREVAADGRKLGEAIARSRATIVQATPATWRLLLASGWQGGEGLKILCGGETLPLDLAEQLAASGSLWNLYGPTEATVWSTAWQAPGAPRRVLIGKPISGTRAHVLDGGGRPVPPGFTGEIHIGGAGLARGYVNRPELDAESFVADPLRPGSEERLYRTGDLGRLLADGSLEFTRRIDDQVKVRGHRIELGEIEAVLAQHPAVQEAAATVRVPAPGDERLVACYVPAAGQPTSTTVLRNHLRQQLPDYMIPQQLVEMDILPRTVGGKIDRNALPVGARGTPPRGSHVEPRTASERLVAGIWGAALGVEHIGVHDNFFELGGHSLLSAQVVAQIESATGVEVSLRAIMLDSLQQVAAACDRSRTASTSGP